MEARIAMGLGGERAAPEEVEEAELVAIAVKDVAELDNEGGPREAEGGRRGPWRPTTPTWSCRQQHRSHSRHHRRFPPIETELIRQREAKRGSSKTEAQDKALNLLRVRLAESH